VKRRAPASAVDQARAWFAQYMTPPPPDHRLVDLLGGVDRSRLAEAERLRAEADKCLVEAQAARDMIAAILREGGRGL